MSRNCWTTAVRRAVITAALISSLGLHAQNATTGGDQQAQPDVQGIRGPGGPGGGPGGQRRGGGVRGTVTAVSGSSVTVKNEQGESWTVFTTDNTRILRDRQTLPISGVQAGDEVMAVGVPDADKHEIHAMMIMDVSAAEAAKARANMGKTYIVGRITAIDDTQLVIMRSDHVSQTITLDETTSLHRGGRMDPQAMQAAGLDTLMGGGFGGGRGGPGGGRRGGNANEGNTGAPPNEQGEAITLADVKVGDTVVGLGSVKGGSFVPTDLRVQTPPQGGRRGQGGMNGGPPPQQQ